MLPSCPNEPEAALLHWLAACTQLPADSPKVQYVLDQCAELRERGFGAITFRFRDGVLYTAEPQIPTMFDGLTSKRKA